MLIKGWQAVLVVAVFGLAGCQFFPSPPPNVHVNVTSPQMPAKVVEPAPAAGRPAASDLSAGLRAPQPLPAAEPISAEPAAEPAPAAVALPPVGSVATLPDVLGPYAPVAAELVREPSRQAEDASPIEQPMVAGQASAGEAAEAPQPASTVPAVPSSPAWQSLGGSGPPALRRATPESAEAGPAEIDQPAAAEPKAAHGFPWIAVGGLLVAVGYGLFPYALKGFHGLQSALRKATGRSPSTSAGAAPHLNPVAAAGGPGAG